MSNAFALNASSSAPDLSPHFESVLKKLNDDFDRFSSRNIEHLCFSFDGLDFDVRWIESMANKRFLVNATVGYMPFTIESDERREAIKTIIMASRTLPRVRFGVDMASKISAAALFDVEQIVLPDFVFYPLTLFMQEARPFIGLIGKYLSAPPLRRPFSIAASVG